MAAQHIARSIPTSSSHHHSRGRKNALDRVTPIQGGAEVGPNPTDRGRPGTKRHLVTDARGTPLGVALSGANRHDSMMLVATLDAVQGLRTRGRGRPRKRPAKLHADKGYDHRRCRRECRARGIKPRIARRGVESSAHLGRHRWVVEIVFTQMTKPNVFAVRGYGQHVSDFDVGVGDHHAVDEQQHELAALLEAGLGQAALHALAKRLQRRRNACELLLAHGVAA